MALAAQGFAEPRPAGRVDRRHASRVLDRVTLLQIDSINVLARSHEIALFSRLGPYPRTLLARLVEADRALFEYWAHEASFVPVGLQPSLRWRMDRARGEAWGPMVRIERERPGYVATVLAEVSERGPIAASELAANGRSGGATSSGPWWDWTDGKTALEFLFWSGQVTASGRGRNFERRYDLPERVLPADVLALPTPDAHEAQRTLLVRGARSLGVGTAGDLADYFRMGLRETRARLAELVENGALSVVTVGGWREPAFLHPSARQPRRVHARALLSPFDSLIWSRPRTERLFGMRVRLEVYTPRARRVHGYYVLPFLLGDALVGRVDLKADRRASALLVAGAHAEPPHDPATVAGPLGQELRAMASWLGLARVELGARGDLIAALARNAG